jgi:hypothetical protein
MEQSDESTKQFLVLAFQLLSSHVQEIASMRASVDLILQYLGEFPEFRERHTREAARLREIYAPDVLRENQTIQKMLALIQAK